MKSFIPIAFALFSLQGVISCKKADQELSPPVDPPPVTPPAAVASPVSLKFMVNNYDYMSIRFKYSELPNKVSVYIDDTLTTDPYDKLFATYSFNKDGYLTGNLFYNNDGTVLHNIDITRVNNSISSIKVTHTENGVPANDVFNVGFRDSTDGYRLMNVDYGTYFEDVPVNMEFTYKNEQLMQTNAGLYMSDENSIFFPSFNYTYNASGSLINKWSDSYYGTDFLYEATGTGLDSLFSLLGGKDWHYLEAILNYDENTSLFFYPLYITLSKNGIDLDIYMHEYGPLAQVRSVANGAEYPYSEVFDFRNDFDEKSRLIQSTITNNGEEYGTYQFGY
ncbi:MAG: hypothetical protein QM802_04450 [Agriterribacter sp.]